MTYATPEEAARGDVRPEYVRVVAVVVRGDRAVVAQVMNADGYPDAYEIETAYCHREDAGWVSGSSGNGNAAVIPTGDDVGTVVIWDEAPPDTGAACFRLGARELTVPVEDGFALAAFDDVPLPDDGWPTAWPRLVSWVARDVGESPP